MVRLEAGCKDALAARAAFVTLFFFAFWFLLLGLSGTLGSGFHLTDDHQIVQLSRTPGGFGLFEAIGWIRTDASTGRFLPVYYIHRMLEIRLFGTDAFLWAVYTGVLASLASSIFAFSLLRAGYGLVEALLFPLLLFLGFQTGVWWRFGTAETIGMFFLSLMCLSAVSAAKGCRRSDWAFVAAGLLLMLSKESFIIFIPAALFLRLWLGASNGLSWPSAARRLLVPGLVLLALSTALLAFIKFFIGTVGIGYAGYDGFKAAPFVKAAVNYAFASNAWVMATGLFLVLAASRRRAASVIPALVLLALSLVPQALLYAKSGVSERYLLPGVFGVAFFAVHMLRTLRESAGKASFISASFGWALAALSVAAGAWMISTPKLARVFGPEDLSSISAARDIPAVHFMASSVHSFASSYGLWLLLAALAVAAAAGFTRKTRAEMPFYALVLAFVSVFNLTIAMDNGLNSALQGWNTNEWLKAIEKGTAPDDAIVVVGDPAMNNEWSLAVKRFLEAGGRANLYAYPVQTKADYTSFEVALAESFGSIYGPGRTGLMAQFGGAKAIAILPGAEGAFLAQAGVDTSAYERSSNEYGFTLYLRQR